MSHFWAEPKVSVVIPAYNAVDSVADVVRMIPPRVGQVVVWDDGSKLQ